MVNRIGCLCYIHQYFYTIRLYIWRFCFENYRTGWMWPICRFVSKVLKYVHLLITHDFFVIKKWGKKICLFLVSAERVGSLNLWYRKVLLQTPFFTTKISTNFHISNNNKWLFFVVLHNLLVGISCGNYWK